MCQTPGVFLEAVTCRCNSVPTMDGPFNRVETCTEVLLTCIGELPHSVTALMGQPICLLPAGEQLDMTRRAVLKQCIWH